MSRVAIAKDQDRYSTVSSVLQVLQGEVEKEIQGQRILIKPNMVNIERALCATHVDAIRAVLDFVYQYAPAEVVVGESSAFQDTRQGFKNYGYSTLHQQYPDLTFVDFNRDAYSIIKLLDVDRHEVNAKISQTATDDWYRISLAVPKTHETALVTLSMKNMMGCLVGYDKALMHGSPRLHADVRMIDSVEPAKQPEMYKVFHRNLIRLIKHVPPSLSVIDGFVGMEREGPVEGDAVNLGVAVASVDYVAADTIMARIMGYDPSDIGYLYYANREGLGMGDLSQITAIGEKIANVMHAFTPHRENKAALQWKQSEWYP